MIDNTKSSATVSAMTISFNVVQKFYLKNSALGSFMTSPEHTFHSREVFSLPAKSEMTQPLEKTFAVERQLNELLNKRLEEQAKEYHLTELDTYYIKKYQCGFSTGKIIICHPTLVASITFQQGMCGIFMPVAVEIPLVMCTPLPPTHTVAKVPHDFRP